MNWAEAHHQPLNSKEQSIGKWLSTCNQRQQYGDFWRRGARRLRQRAAARRRACSRSRSSLTRSPPQWTYHRRKSDRTAPPPGGSHEVSPSLPAVVGDRPSSAVERDLTRFLPRQAQKKKRRRAWDFYLSGTGREKTSETFTNRRPAWQLKNRSIFYEPVVYEPIVWAVGAYTNLQAVVLFPESGKSPFPDWGIKILQRVSFWTWHLYFYMHFLIILAEN